ncbi:MAG: AAA family ATPase [Lachnospiraceae bacterium]|nr:AAA family ATPase [Lachnospiraceae bacterium]
MAFGKRKWEKDEKAGGRIPGGTVAVWGSGDCGKTVTSIKMAERLTGMGRNVLLIFADAETPVFPYGCPPSDLMGEGSLGRVLAAPHVDEQLVKENCVFYKKNKYLSMLGWRKGENRFTHPAFNDARVAELLKAAEGVAPFVIVDCTSGIATDVLTANALLLADSVIRMTGCDLKSVSYLSSQLPLLSDAKWNMAGHVKVAGNVMPNEAQGNADGILGKAAFRIPHSLEVEKQFLEGELFSELCYKESRSFRNEIARLSEEVFGA